MTDTIAAICAVVLAVLYAALLVFMIVKTRGKTVTLTPKDIADHRDNCPVCSGPTLEDQQEWAEMSNQ